MSVSLIFDSNDSESAASCSSIASPVSPPQPDQELCSLSPLLRTLIIDNYDSFTYNLSQAVHTMTGHCPTILYNTASWEQDVLPILSSIDCIILSPGPGHPTSPKDFGVCSTILSDDRTKHMPILGVCLGLQGMIACTQPHLTAQDLHYAFWQDLPHTTPTSIPLSEHDRGTPGVVTFSASGPVHGRVVPIYHDSVGCFRDVPQGSGVVRYNSLVAPWHSIPHTYTISAWCQIIKENNHTQTLSSSSLPSSSATNVSEVEMNDKEVMGIRHCILPREAVQYHPESICTTHGLLMIRNFLKLAAQWRQLRLKHNLSSCTPLSHHTQTTSSTPSPSSSTSSPASTIADSKTEHKPFTLLYQPIPFAVEAEEVFALLYDHHSSSSTNSASSTSNKSHLSAWWLDSSKVEKGRSRYSYMGDNASPLSFILQLYLNLTTTTTTDKHHQTHSHANTKVTRLVKQKLAARSSLETHSLWDIEVSDLNNSQDFFTHLKTILDAHACDTQEVASPSQTSPSLSSSLSSSVDSPPFDFTGGFVGYLGYEVRDACAPSELPPLFASWDGRVILKEDDERDEKNGSDNSDSSNSSSSPLQSTETKAESRQPDATLIFADRFIAFDHEAKKAWVCALVPRQADSSSAHAAWSGAQWLQQTRETLTQLQNGQHPVRLENAHLTQAISHSLASPTPTSSLPSTTTSSLNLSWRHEGASYLKRIQACLSQISAGESYELCLTNRLSGMLPARLDTFFLYRVLRRVNPAPYASFLRFRLERTIQGHDTKDSAIPQHTATHFTVCCSSPERFLRVRAVPSTTASATVSTHPTLEVEAKPIKGTIRRGTTPEEDMKLKSELASSEKDFAENLMIVDLLRNDLSHVSAAGSVYVPRLMEVESYATIHTLVSTVRGVLLPDKDSVDCITHAFPPGSMTGAPKLRSCQILEQLEQGPRGIYSGCLGFLSTNKNMDMNVVIRTAVVDEHVVQYNNTSAHPLYIGAGGAIIYLSDADGEYQEMELKTAALRKAFSIALHLFQQSKEKQHS